MAHPFELAHHVPDFIPPSGKELVRTPTAMALSRVAEDSPKRIDLAEMIPLPLLCPQFHYDQFYLRASSACPRDSFTMNAPGSQIWRNRERLSPPPGWG